MKPALLLVDLQNDYLCAERLEPAAGEIVARAAALLDLWRRAGAPVVHVWTTVSREADRRMPHWVRAERWICVEGTEGHATPLALRRHAAERVVHKTFFSGFGTGELERLLRTAGCDAVVIAGVHEHGCVRATALDAYQAGFAVWIAEDAIGSDDPLHAAVTRRYLGARAIRYAPVEAIARSLRPASTPSASRRIARLASWIGGREAPGDRDALLVHASPVSGEPVWEMSEAGPEEVARAARDAARAQASWESAPLATRVAVIVPSWRARAPSSGPRCSGRRIPSRFPAASTRRRAIDRSAPSPSSRRGTIRLRSRPARSSPRCSSGTAS